MKNVLTQFLLTATFVVSPFLVFAGDFHMSEGAIFWIFVLLSIPFIAFIAGIVSLISFIDRKTKKRRRVLIVFMVIQTFCLMMISSAADMHNPIVPICTIILMVEFLCAVLMKVDEVEKEATVDAGERLIIENESSEGGNGDQPVG